MRRKNEFNQLPKEVQERMLESDFWGKFVSCKKRPKDEVSEEEKIEVEYEEVFKQPVNKYKVPCKGVEIDVYDVLKAFSVTCPGTQHAVKKLLKTGKRGYKDNKQDLNEAIKSIIRAIELI